MKRILTVAVLVVWVLCGSPSQGAGLKADQDAKAEQGLMKAEREWTEAYKNRDKAVLDRILADDFIFTDDEGNLYGKAQYITAATELISVPSYSIDAITVRVYGDTGIVAGRWTGKLIINGQDASGAFRFTDIFVKRQGHWQTIASQETRIIKQESD